jgi:hypothetical protein
MHLSFSTNSQCQEVQNELKRLKRQLAAKNGDVATPQSNEIRFIVELLFLISRWTCFGI